MRRYTLRIPDPIESARCLRSLDDGRSAFRPGRAAPRKWDASAWVYEPEAGSNFTSIVRSQLTSQALPIHWRHRDRATQAIWPPESDIVTWAGIGAMHALAPLYPRPTFPIFKTDDQRPHALAYLAAYAAVIGAYMTQDATSTVDAPQWAPPEHPPMLGPWRTSAHSTPLLDEAMCVAQEMIEAAPKTANNPHFKKKYADLSSVIAAIKPACIAARIARYQPAWTDDKPGVIVTTRLAHKGEWCEADLRIPVDKSNAQALGSAITYGRRYGLSTAFGVPTEDDDGNQAAASPPPETAPDLAPIDYCDPKTASAIGTLCHQIASLAGVDHRAVFKGAWTGAGFQYNAEVNEPRNLSKQEAIKVHGWLDNDYRTNYSTDDQRQPGEDRDAP